MKTVLIYKKLFGFEGRLIATLILMINVNFTVFALETSWPKVITLPNGIITVYQPQPESLDGTALSGRAAISVKHKEAKRATYGAIWITTKLEVDRDSRIAVLKNIKIPNIRFSDDLDSVTIGKITRIIEEEMPKWNLEIAMDDLITTLETAATNTGKNYKNDAPEIIVTYTPSILVFIDGEPKLKKMDNSDFQRIMNTPFFVIYDEKKKEYYIYSETHWVTSETLNGKWVMLKKESKDLKKLREDILKANPPKDPTASTEPPVTIPDIVVRTTQAELISFDGEPKFKPIEKTNLLYVENTTNNVFMDIESQNYFILVSGRWYMSKTLTGPWTFTEADKLPADFAKIPEGTEKDVVLASVAGTNAANDAVLDAQIPQTAEVDRNTATVNVEYDGDPKFEKVDGTSMQYAVNSPQTVLKVGEKFYCVDNGIWFVAPTAKGVWAVSDTRPEEVENIEPSSSVYNVKYVYIYESTPEVVYVGYTPGYYGSYVYGPTVIYGTGWPYYPWYGAYYYPRPVTYGFSVHYNPWTGWGVGFGMAWGPVHMSFGGFYGGYYGGYYGCGGYHPPYHYHGGGYYGHGGGYYPGNGGANRPDGGYNRPSGGDRPGVGGRPTTLPSNNIYGNNRAGVKPNTNRVSTGNSDANRGTRPSQRPSNNVYTDKSGNVYKKTDKGWDTRQGNNWKSADKAPTRSAKAENPTNRVNTGNTSNRANAGFSNGSSNVSNRANTGASVNRTTPQSSYNRSELDRQAANRNRGTTRTSNYNNYSRSAASRPSGYGGGMSRGGGMRGGGRR